MNSFEDQAESLFGKELLSFFHVIGNLAIAHNTKSFLVGGMVRDLLLGVNSTDIDIMLLSDVGRFVEILSNRWSEIFPLYQSPKKPVVFKKYFTAKLVFAESFVSSVDVLDFSSARKEIYPTPGQPPIVEFGTLEEDLQRRDFSVNAMALSLGVNDFFHLIDPLGGIQDIRDGKLRVLHDNSFVEDPARILRAVRLMQRLNFRLEEKTKRLFDEAVDGNLLKTLPGFRLFDEFKKGLLESSSLDYLRILDELSILHQINSDFKISNLDSPNTNLSTWGCLVLALLNHLGPMEREKSLLKFNLPPKIISQMKQ